MSAKTRFVIPLLAVAAVALTACGPAIDGSVAVYLSTSGQTMAIAYACSEKPAVAELTLGTDGTGSIPDGPALTRWRLSPSGMDPKIVEWPLTQASPAASVTDGEIQEALPVKNLRLAARPEDSTLAFKPVEFELADLKALKSNRYLFNVSGKRVEGSRDEFIRSACQ